MRLDAAPSPLLRTPAAKAKAIGGVAPDPAITADAPEPPPSIDGKGTLINTYA